MGTIGADAMRSQGGDAEGCPLERLNLAPLRALPLWDESTGSWRARGGPAPGAWCSQVACGLVAAVLPAAAEAQQAAACATERNSAGEDLRQRPGAAGAALRERLAEGQPLLSGLTGSDAAASAPSGQEGLAVTSDEASSPPAPASIEDHVLQLLGRCSAPLAPLLAAALAPSAGAGGGGNDGQDGGGSAAAVAARLARCALDRATVAACMGPAAPGLQGPVGASLGLRGSAFTAQSSSGDGGESLAAAGRVARSSSGGCRRPVLAESLLPPDTWEVKGGSADGDSATAREGGGLGAPGSGPDAAALTWRGGCSCTQEWAPVCEAGGRGAQFPNSCFADCMGAASAVGSCADLLLTQPYEVGQQHQPAAGAGSTNSPTRPPPQAPPRVAPSAPAHGASSGSTASSEPLVSVFTASVPRPEPQQSNPFTAVVTAGPSSPPPPPTGAAPAGAATDGTPGASDPRQTFLAAAPSGDSRGGGAAPSIDMQQLAPGLSGTAPTSPMLLLAQLLQPAVDLLAAAPGLPGGLAAGPDSSLDGGGSGACGGLLSASADDATGPAAAAADFSDPVCLGRLLYLLELVSAAAITPPPLVPLPLPELLPPLAGGNGSPGDGQGVSGGAFEGEGGGPGPSAEPSSLLELLAGAQEGSG
ncbi:hypothetical protein HYH03_002078 [Edaphochlamys debaryana]|uniref:Kazal-like domain-containing protein n=1 Tax=Edaphochlamys debaryana TaxID=47281 RepID=A0A836C449_9CHLO|nr:hypothetical protein HYH03_002078 [Edaphochlamys debaryana]|eukprot:KAG2499781.1 hypothetical protein HYH03_002078 [Edaphochlamys debaryana]